MATATLQQRHASAVPSALESPPAQVRILVNLTEQQQPHRRRRQQQRQHKQPETAIVMPGPRLSSPMGARALATAGGIMVAAASTHPAPASSALAVAAAAPAVADPSAGPVYRYRKREGAADAAAECTEQVQQGAPLLFSRTAGQVYVLMEPIVGMEGAKPHTDLHMAAPIVVLNMKEALSPIGGATGADVLFRPHSTKRVAVKVRGEGRQTCSLA